MQLLSKDCPRPISHDTVLTVVGVIRTKCIDIFLKYCIYCCCVCSAQSSTVDLTLACNTMENSSVAWLLSHSLLEWKFINLYFILIDDSDLIVLLNRSRSRR